MKTSQLVFERASEEIVVADELAVARSLSPRHSSGAALLIQRNLSLLLNLLLKLSLVASQFLALSIELHRVVVVDVGFQELLSLFFASFEPTGVLHGGLRCLLVSHKGSWRSPAAVSLVRRSVRTTASEIAVATSSSP